MADIGVGDKGWDFLSTPVPEDGETAWDNVDGCDVNYDGSKSYRDDNGGWGYREADGSGSYTGADGSWGSWNSDGSFSYTGADGSWASGSADGSGSYTGADGSWGSWNSDGEYSISFSSGDYESGTVEEHGGFIDFSGQAKSSERDDSCADVASFHGYSAYTPRFTIPVSVPDETVDRLRTVGEYMGQVAAAKKEIHHYEAKERRRRFLSRHWKKLLIALAITLLAGGVAFVAVELQRLIPTGVNANDVVGKPYEDVVAEFEKSGFTNVSSEPLKDLSPQNKDSEGLVNDVNILGNESFDEHMSYPYDMPVTVHYHSMRVANPPVSSRSASGENYEFVVKQFEDAGFVNVTAEPCTDSLFGVFNKPNEVASVTIDSSDDYSTSKEYRIDSEVVVTYHTPVFGGQ